MKKLLLSSAVTIAAVSSASANEFGVSTVLTYAGGELTNSDPVFSYSSDFDGYDYGLTFTTTGDVSNYVFSPMSENLSLETITGLGTNLNAPAEIGAILYFLL